MAAQVISIPERLRPKKSTEYPPIQFRTRLEQLMSDHPQKPSPYDLAVALEVTPPTVYKYLKGCSVPLLHAMQLAAILSTSDRKLKVEDIWSVK